MNLDVQHLRAELPERRWFADKGHDIQNVTVVDHGVVRDGDESLVLAVVRIELATKGPVLYHLPLLVSSDGLARDATEDASAFAAIGELLVHGTPVQGEHGTFHFSGPGLDPSSPPGGEGIRLMGAEQSNTSIVLDDSVIVKFFRKVEPGVNPDIELTRLLTNAGFNFIPPQLGEIFYEGDIDGETVEIDLAIAQRFVAGAKEGWEYTLEEIRRLLDEVHPQDVGEDIPQLIEERAADLLTAIDSLGDAVGALHVALSLEDTEPDVRPEPLEEYELQTYAKRVLTEAAELAEEVPELARWQDEIEEQLNVAALVTDAGQKIRVHGDLHLGQVLRTPRSWMVLDFEGEPARSLEERRNKQSPLKDVTGMLRSFSYAANAVLFERAEAGSEEWERLGRWTSCWEALARHRFLSAYLTRSHEGRFLTHDRQSLNALLDLFEMDKALYEVAYERGSRPQWIRIPLQGIARIVERGDEG